MNELNIRNFAPLRFLSDAEIAQNVKTLLKGLVLTARDPELSYEDRHEVELTLQGLYWACTNSAEAYEQGYRVRQLEREAYERQWPLMSELAHAVQEGYPDEVLPWDEFERLEAWMDGYDN